MKEIQWDPMFPPAYGTINIPANMVFYRGYSTRFPVVSRRPAYFGSLRTAVAYGSGGTDRVYSAFTNTHPLRLFDVRFMKGMLRDVFETNPGDESSLPVVLSFGLCSLHHQLYLMKLRYPEKVEGHKRLVDAYDPIVSAFEQPGVRVGETTNDAYTMAFLGAFFAGYIDGFVSPAIKSPYHHENTLSPEMIIFNPVASGIRKLPSIPRGVELITFDRLYSAEFGKKFTHKQYSAYMKGGSDGDGSDDSVMLTSVEDANERGDDPEIQTMIERGDAAGRQWNARVGFELDLPIVETLQVRPWPTTVAKARSTTRRLKREHSLPRRPQL